MSEGKIVDGGIGSGPSQTLRIPGQTVSETPERLRRLAQLTALRLLLPALASGIGMALAVSDLGDGLVAALAVYVSVSALDRIPLPLTLMPASRVLVALLGPLSGCGALAVASTLGSGLGPDTALELLIPVAAGFVVAVASDLLAARVMSTRPIRVAVLGSEVFAIGLQGELVESQFRFIELVPWDEDRLSIAASGDEGAGDRVAAEAERRAIDLLIYGPDPGEPLPGSGSDFNRKVGLACLDRRVRLIDGNQFYEEVFGHVPLGTINSAWYLFLVHPGFRPPPTLLRRGFDLLAALPVALVVSPLILLAAIAIKLTDRGPVFYRQVRVGARGAHFEILKLRTMREDAERTGVQFSRSGDPRVTGVGRILRRTHIDELPQIINVLRGDMRFVGPRPERPEIVAEMERIFPHYNRRLLLKPGVTGWAQVRCGYAGSALGTAWKLCHDLYYLKRRSMLGDLLIMFETLAIAAKDAHRPMRVPESQFLSGRNLGIDTSADEAGGIPEADQLLPGDAA